MNQYKLLDINGQQDLSGKEFFTAIMQIAIEEVVQNKFANTPLNMPFRIDQDLVLEAYEKLKAINYNGISGQQMQEFLIASILKYYWEQKFGMNLLLAFPDSAANDAILIQKDVSDLLKKVSNDKVLPTKPVTVYFLQIKELREEGNMLDLIQRPTGAEEVNFTESKIFEEFKKYFENKIRKTQSYQDCLLVVFARAQINNPIKIKSLISAFRELNNGFFKNIWFISPVGRLVESGGVIVKGKKKEGWNFEFLVKELITGNPDTFDTLDINCKFRNYYYKRPAA